ncbi:nucleolar protein of 40 kDa-like [Trichogramma pretiosum]|uniref:nucleolar protein of 40 kDa-like n=1 Tax=Trichogramma pretiosum TaxID=7493 RepID=UPI0006C9DBB8|nr:nucleolar protein of 40 kDa-like [Trichogramma pretiosum]
MTACELNQIFVGEVASVQNYGAFVRIPGCKQQGLVHKSQVSSSHVDDVAEVLNRGDKIWCKVISIADDGKIALSMKLVNQGNGKDLDPNGVQLQLDEQKKKRYDPKAERKAIELGAVYKTVCSQCKTPGHIAKYCFTKPGGKTYDLLPSEEEEEVMQVVPKTQKSLPPNTELEHEVEPLRKEKETKEKKHKSKKSKKRKKSKKHDDSDSDESDDGEKSKKKKKKSKEQKKKKRKRKYSTSDSDSSDSSVSSHENRKRSKKCKHSKAKHSD